MILWVLYIYIYFCYSQHSCSNWVSHQGPPHFILVQQCFVFCLFYSWHTTQCSFVLHWGILLHWVCYILVKHWPSFCRGQRNGRVVQNGMSENDSLQVHCRYSFRAIKLVWDKTRIVFNPWFKKQKGFTWENNPKLDEINFSEEITINLWKSWSFRARHSPHLVIPDLASVMHKVWQPPCILDTRLALKIQRVVSNL